MKIIKKPGNVPAFLFFLKIVNLSFPSILAKSFAKPINLDYI
jgi:hypothetical protein